MRTVYLKRQAITKLILISAIILLFAGCGNSTSQQAKAIPSPTPVPSTLLYIEAGVEISAVRTADGNLAQNYLIPSPNGVSSDGFPFTVAQGAIYLAMPEQIVAIKTDGGKQLWSVPSSDDAEAIVATQDTVFVSLRGGLLYAFDSKTGAMRWRLTINSEITSLNLLVDNDLL